MDDDDFEFSDDALDALPANTLQQLEQDALQFTQHPQKKASWAPQTRNGLSTRPVQSPQARIPPVRDQHQAPSPPPSSDYGFDDEDVIDLDEQSVPLVQQRSAVAAHQSIPPQGRPYQAPPQSVIHAPHEQTQSHPYQAANRAAPGQQFTESAYVSAYHHEHIQEVGSEHDSGAWKQVDASADGGLNVDELLARVQELEQERSTLQKTVEEAKSAAQSKAGEIAIVRSKHDKASKEYERRISFMQKLHADEIARQKAELEVARKDREKVETNNRFLEHDLAREAAKSRKTTKDSTNNRSKVQGRPASVTTPKKTRALLFRDGFDDDDIVMVSPPKAQDKTKAATPKAGSKRKRPNAEQLEQSPVRPLQLSESIELAKSPEAAPPAQPVAPRDDAALIVRLEEEDERFQFVQNILNHRPYGSSDRTLEALTGFVLPSKPDKKLSSVVYDKLSLLHVEQGDSHYPNAVCNVFITLWEQCLNESYYQPLDLLIDAIQFVIDLSPMRSSLALIERLVPLSIATSVLVAEPLSQASINANRHPPSVDPNIQKLHSAAPSPVSLSEFIDVDACLSILSSLASSASVSPEALVRFWQHMKYDFVPLMLNKAQPLSQIILMLRLLATSPLETTFGVIEVIRSADPSDAAATLELATRQTRTETSTLDALLNLLFERPETRPDEPPYTPVDITTLRIEVLRLLGALCTTHHGSKALATHRLAIPRLLKFLHDAITALYAYTPSTHALTATAVNLATRLLYHLVTKHADVVDLRAKLGVPVAGGGGQGGGAHRYLVALTRLAFREEWVLEAGVEVEVSDAAHELLDEWVSPEEGEALMQVFSSGVGSAGTG